MRHGARAVVGPVPATEPRPAGCVRRRVLAGNSSPPVGNRTECVRVMNYSPPLASWLAWSYVTRGESWAKVFLDRDPNHGTDVGVEASAVEDLLSARFGVD